MEKRLDSQDANSRAAILLPGAKVLHGVCAAEVLAIDPDPGALVWIVYADDADADAFVRREDLRVCE